MVFAGALPLFDIGTDILVINGIFANNTALNKFCGNRTTASLAIIRAFACGTDRITVSDYDQAMICITLHKYLKLRVGYRHPSREGH